MFAWRTALLPFTDLFDGSGVAASMTSEDADFDAAVAADRDQFRTRLREIVARAELREAIFLASPGLHEQVGAWLANPDGERSEKVERALMRYVTRSCGRATPFGLFAGCSVGRIDRHTRLVLDAQINYRRHTRLDMEYVCALAASLAADETLRGQLAFRPNSTLIKSSDVLRYAEARMQGDERSYHLVAVEETDYLRATLDRAASGATADDLAAALVDGDITMEEAREFVGELIASQLLVPELEPSVTGPEPIHSLVDCLANHESASDARQKLVDARDELARFDAAGLGVEPQTYLDLAEKLKELPAAVHLSRLFQVDMVKPTPEATLGIDVFKELQRAIEILHAMAPPASRDSLAEFRNAFVERYGDRMAPLAEVLDEETGIGFERSNAPAAEAAPLLAGLSFPSLGQTSGTWTSRDNFLLQKLSHALASGEQQIVLTDDDLKRLATAKPAPLPDAMSAAATIAAASDDALARGEFRVCLHGIAGPSGARLLGRFCHADEQLAQLVDAHLRAEEALRRDAIFAEVVHLPEGRLGNVLLRPVLRKYEIPFAGKSGAPQVNQIDLTDLMVRVVGDRIELHSRRLGREIVPRLSTAHNFAWKSLGVYRFLGHLQSQGLCSWLAWSWGALSGAPFLPRVAVGRLVLSRAQWTITRDEIKMLCSKRGAEAFRAVQLLRHERRMPRFVSLVDGDNELPVDLDRALCVDTLLDQLKNRGQATLAEFFPTADEMPASGPEGRYVHEVVVAVVRTADVAPAVQVAIERPAPARQVQRQFAPGSEWLYVNLYCGTAAADELLRELVRPVTRELLASGAIDRWFFIRYGDPNWHLRVRLHGDPQRLLSEALPIIERAAGARLASGQITRWNVDTYVREVERYGGPAGIALAEAAFCVDSEAALALVEAYRGDAGLDVLWRLAVVGIDRLLDDMGLDANAKLRIMRQARDGMANEFGAEYGLTPQIAQKFRGERKNLEEALHGGSIDDEGPLSRGTAILSERTGRLSPILADMASLAAKGELTVDVESLAISFMHMFVNRVLRSAQRAQELVLYDFLTRLYESQTARRDKAHAACES
jgi:thiopeptide-type bacteriocin biosynthesis protein